MHFSIQYLEDRRNLATLSPIKAAQRLHRAGERLPFSHVLIGWNLPLRVLQACRKETEQMHAQFFRWHPLLTGDGSLVPRPKWQVIGLNGERVAGSPEHPEFTFMCPNNPNVQQEILAYLSNILDTGLYDGLFLDRIRFPSPTGNPEAYLGCFCKYCRKQAEGDELDLKDIQKKLCNLIKHPQGKVQFARALLGDSDSIFNEEYRNAFEKFYTFRYRSIERFLVSIASLVNQAGLRIGLDCFSPSLTPLVGQDLKKLGDHVEWVKIMTYAHTMGPAGLPYELFGLLNYLEKSAFLSEREGLDVISLSTGLLLPNDRKNLEKNGLSPSALKAEITKGLVPATTKIFAGIELVEIPGVAQLNEHQIQNDLEALKESGPDGIALSWDLYKIPLRRLDLVRDIFL